MQEDDFSEEQLLLPQYPGDDTRPTSRKELAGWYSYGWAAEVFVVCAMSTLSVSLISICYSTTAGNPLADILAMMQALFYP